MVVDLHPRLRKVAEECGIDLFGVADLDYARHIVEEQSGLSIEEFPRALSLGIILPHAIVDQLPHREERRFAVAYHTHAYEVINRRLDQTASIMSSLIQKNGYRAFPIPASERADDEKMSAQFSHKLAAHLAGLGWIGKSCLLITPQAGPRVRWTTVLTDAPLPVGEPMEERCGGCEECVDICPQKAFTGRSFHEEEPREARYDARKCQGYLRELEASTGLGVCGMCLYVCPHGRR
jgi:epoxyqueuosine reductase